MGSIEISAGSWILVVPFTPEGFEVANKFIDMLETTLKEKEAEA